jgi:hypothetical protein
MRNPLPSETAVFHAVVVVGAGAASIIALTLLTRPLFGAILLALEAVAGLWVLWRRARSEPVDSAEAGREPG